MINVTKSLFTLGTMAIVLQGMTRPVLAQEDDTSSIIVVRINAAEFLGRYGYVISIAKNCDVLLKEINPRCPELRGEISFNMSQIRAENDDVAGALRIETIDQSKSIRQRYYYRGESVKSRRFCEAPEGSTLKYEDEMYYEKALFYSDDKPLMTELTDSFNALGEACRVEKAN